MKKWINNRRRLTATAQKSQSKRQTKQRKNFLARKKADEKYTTFNWMEETQQTKGGKKNKPNEKKLASVNTEKKNIVM